MHVSFWQKTKRSKRIRRGPARDKNYLAWIRTQPCLICGSTFEIEAGHTGDDGGLAQKSSDYSTVPMCSDCHTQAAGAYHRGTKREFEQRHGIDLDVICRNLKHQYERGIMSFGQPANSLGDWEHGERERERIDEGNWDLQQPLQPLKQVVSVIHVQEWGCACVQVDVDQWDARGCALHGECGEEKMMEAQELAEYYAVDFDEQLPARKPPASETSSTGGSSVIDMHDSCLVKKQKGLN